MGAEGENFDGNFGSHNNLIYLVSSDIIPIEQEIMDSGSGFGAKTIKFCVKLVKRVHSLSAG